MGRRKNQDVKAKGHGYLLQNMKQLVFDMCPSSTNHTYHTSGGKWYKSASMVEWERDCLWLLKGKVKKVKLSPVNTLCVNICFFFGNKRKNDIDGRIKPVLDLLQKLGAYEDDSLITDLIVAKRFDKEKPRIEVDIY